MSEPPTLFDTHAHLHDPWIGDDLPDVMARASEAEVGHIVTIGCSLWKTAKTPSPSPSNTTTPGPRSESTRTTPRTGTLRQGQNSGTWLGTSE